MNPGIRFFSGRFLNGLLNPLSHQDSNLFCLHFSIILIIQRLQEMDLDGDRADGVGVKGFEGVYQSDGYNGASGFCGGLKASALNS